MAHSSSAPWASCAGGVTSCPLLVEDSGLRYEIAELGPAAAAEGGGEFGDVGTAGPYVHPEAAGDGLVDVALHQQFGDGVLYLRYTVGRRLVGCAGGQRDRAAPHELEHLDEISDEPRVPEFQRDLAVVLHGDEGDRLVADDETLHQFVDGAVLRPAVGELLDVRQPFGVEPRGVLVEGAYAHTALDEQPVALEALQQAAFGPVAARLDGQHLRTALGGGQVQCAVDAVVALEHRDGVGGGDLLGAQRHERLESVGEFDRQLPALGDLPLQRAQPLRERDRGQHGTQPLGVVGIRMKEGEIHQAGRGLHFRAGDTSRAESIRVQSHPLIAQLSHRMRMCRISLFRCQFSTPQGPEHAGT
ncbi:hypothetical protein SHKM778_02030 [Streptomyces sp. KM77-8]|uniref:Uncharacterized protein n=1 Tax=Streptomyces haneummycinicus TaxID=3074435 RepID=A0AAT9H8X6_9ACTN